MYGFCSKEGEISLNDVRFNVKTDFATVAISSLTDEPIRSSDNLLLTAVGRQITRIVNIMKIVHNNWIRVMVQY